MIAALYFPQSDFTIRIPYNARSRNGLMTHLNLLTLRTLKNDSTIPHSQYQILPLKEKLASLDSKNGSVILQALPKNGTS